MIDACLFDMGNVLVFFSHAVMCQQMADVCGCTVDEIRRMLFDSRWQHEIESGLISDAEFHRRWEQHLQRTIDAAALKHAACDIFQPNLEIIPILESLKQQGKRLVLLSNTCLAHLEFVQRQSPILRAFDDLTLSYEVGSMKPDPPIYHDAVKKSGTTPDRCFYTDDVLENITAARGLGIRSEVYTSNSELRRHLAELGLQVP